MKYSFIIPVYNVEKVIRRCIDSILYQTIQDFEIILIDDGSSDRSGEICDSYSSRDNRIVVIHKNNAGVSSTRNMGLERVKGQYIIFLDSDDYIEPDYLEVLDKNEADLKIIGYKIEDEYGRTKKINQYEEKIEPILTSEQLAEAFKEGDFNYIWGKCFRTDIIKEHNINFDVNVSLAEDTLFVLEYVKYITSIKYLSDIGYHYIKYNTETLTKIDFNSDSTVNKFEKVNDIIYDQLFRILGTDADLLIERRMANLYKDILAIINGGQKCSFIFIYSLFKKKWFKKMLSHTDQYFENENEKYRMILKTQSSIIFWIYLKYKIKSENRDER